MPRTARIRLPTSDPVLVAMSHTPSRDHSLSGAATCRRPGFVLGARQLTRRPAGGPALRHHIALQVTLRESFQWLTVPSGACSGVFTAPHQAEPHQAEPHQAEPHQATPTIASVAPGGCASPGGPALGETDACGSAAKSAPRIEASPHQAARLATRSSEPSHASQRATVRRGDSVYGAGPHRAGPLAA